MEKLIGTVIEYGGAKYQVTGYTCISAKYPSMAKACFNTGKYQAIFGAAKILKNGSLSKKQTIAVLFFIESENFVKL